MDVGDDERHLVCGREGDARPKVNRQCAVWILKDNPCSWKNMNCKFHMSLGSMASEGKDAMSISNEPQRCMGVKWCRYECFWYDDRRTLDGE